MAGPSPDSSRRTLGMRRRSCWQSTIRGRWSAPRSMTRSAAARSFIASKPRADAIAVLAFGPHPVSLSGLSTATIDTDVALRNITVAGRQGTALYDAIVAGAGQLRASPLVGRVLIVLTDGADVSSKATLEQAVFDCSRGSSFDLPDRNRRRRLRSGAAAAARTRNRWPVLRHRVDRVACWGLQLDREAARPYVDGFLCHGGPARRPCQGRGVGAGRGILVIRACRTAAGRRREHSAGAVALAAEVRLRISRWNRRWTRRRRARACCVSPAPGRPARQLAPRAAPGTHRRRTPHEASVPRAAARRNYRCAPRHRARVRAPAPLEARADDARARRHSFAGSRIRVHRVRIVAAARDARRQSPARPRS